MNKLIQKMTPFLNSFTSRLNYGSTEFKDNLFLAEELISEDKHKSILIKDHEVLFGYKIHPSTLNYWGAMHGGAISTLVDIASTIAITGLDKNHRKNISIELSTKFLSPVVPDLKVVYILCSIQKIGKNVAFSTIEVIEPKNLKVIVTASHTKAMLDAHWEIENKRI